MSSTVDHRTPTLTANDPRHLPVRQVAYLRKVANGPVQALITRQHFNAAGQQVALWDPRLFGSAIRPNQSTVHGLTGTALKSVSADAGWGLSLNGLAGEALQRWDQRGNHWRTTYDELLRPVAVEENAQPNVDRFSYADATADPGFNRRGQLIEQVDASGVVQLERYSLQGYPLSEQRTWIDDDACYISHQSVSPLGAVLKQTDAGGHSQTSLYDVAGQLKRVQLQIANADGGTFILEDAQYNAAGQVIERKAGNRVISRWTYTPAEGRLDTITAGKPGEALRQHLKYVYDPVGNILRIEDHVLATVYFANQRVDGHRDFTYDTLYRLCSASGFEAEKPNLEPGLPEPIQPIDPGGRYRYTEHYEYDTGNNLIELCHVRDGNCFTRQMKIDPHSNRGVHWKEGDPQPIFDEHFDAHGNQRVLQRGSQPLTWNARDQLAKVTLLQHANGLPDDEETYRYSQGERVYKCHVSHTPSVTHRREVRYLPGLEIHRSSDGQHLHVIILPGARCLHWVSLKPDDIEDDQLRYSLDDHLGSCSLELDRDARLISLEFYYPYGGTAWWAARSALEASYKTIRYSGKEMDVSGLYYYGARYYAPWLQRWISADPAGYIDGMNLYEMVGSNPIGYVDSEGENKHSHLSLREGVARIAAMNSASHQRARERDAPRRERLELSNSINRHLDILGLSKRRALDAQQQILNHRSTSEQAISTARRTAVHLVGQGVSYGAGIAVGIGAQALGVVAPGVGNVVGVALGFGTKKAVGLAVDYIAERTGASASVKLKGGKLSPEKIIMKAEYKSMNFPEYMKQKYQNMNVTSQKGLLKGAKEVTSTGSGFILKAVAPEIAREGSASISTALGMVEIIHEVSGASDELSPEKIAKADNNLTRLIDALNANMAAIEGKFESTGVDALHTFSFLGNNAGDTAASLRQTTNAVINELAYTRTMLRSRSSQFSSV
ncbi:RHS repeat-associated core domain-containing protein [Pseudomonas frederiksbergensis]|nr:RHS repeat-associated core domain-containing protein [Pseudomonas frederiksbergensis]